MDWGLVFGLPSAMKSLCEGAKKGFHLPTGQFE